MKDCPHSRDHWYVKTVADYEREHGEQTWLDERSRTDIISAFCETCERRLTFGESNDDMAENEIRAAEIIYGMEATTLDDGVRVTDRSVTVTPGEYRGMCGYLCPLTFTPSRYSEAEIGWLACAVVDLEDPPYDLYSYQHNESDLGRVFAALIVDEFFAQQRVLRFHERRSDEMQGDIDAAHRYAAELEAKIEALEAQAMVDAALALPEAAEAGAECSPVWEGVDETTEAR